jgi:hypothetical protein
VSILLIALAAWLALSIGGTTVALLILAVLERLDRRRARRHPEAPLCPVVSLDTHRHRRLGGAA